MTVSHRFGSLILTVSLLAVVTAGSVPAAPAASSPEAKTTAPPADQPKAQQKAPAEATSADDDDSPADADQPTAAQEPTATSEALIAAALEAGKISYEASLRERAFALYDDPRLDARFRSPVIDWEAGRALFAEIDEKAASLSKELLADLAPIRARPSNEISVFNRRGTGKQSFHTPRESLVRRVATRTPAQARCITVTKMDVSWKSYLVPGTTIRLWLQHGTEGELKNVFAPMVGKVWRAFPDYFTYPLPDTGNVCDESNPDSAVDMYLVIGSTADPREKLCSLPTAPSSCTLSGLRAAGAAPFVDSTTPSKSSAYMLINIDTPDRTSVLDTIAHELAHAAQAAYDAHDESWLYESTATWVAYKVFKALGNTPRQEYKLLQDFASDRDMAPLFPNLHMKLNWTPNRYGAWLFFYSASVDLGDGIVKAVWQAAVGPTRGIEAVDRVIRLDEHFPRYAVRSWNQDLTPQPWPYKTDDKTFPSDLKPDPITPVKFRKATIKTLNQPVDPLAIRYHRATFADGIRKVTFENFFASIPYAHVWAVKKIGNDWKEPEDWSKAEQKIFCRDLDDENLTELIIVVSNTHRQFPLPPDPAPRIIGDSVGCDYIAGWAQASFRVTQGDNDVSYVSSRATLKFKPLPSPLQTTSGATHYYLTPTAVTWTASGKEGDCTISGQIVVNFPNLESEPLDTIGMQPAYGYLYVVGQDGGDFHSVKVSATNPKAFFKKTCPDDPPRVTDYYPHVVWLLLVLSEKNTYIGSTIAFKGSKTVDVAQPTGFLDLLPPGTVLPDNVMQALSQAPASSRSEVYTWNWDLAPLNVGTTSGP